VTGVQTCALPIFPNTAYAKLFTGIGNAELIQRGLLYLLMSLKRDPITLIICSYAIILTIIKKDRFHYLISLGIILYIAYIVKIGGDFMSGRFLSLPFFCALIILSRFNTHTIRKQGYLFPLLIVIICALLGSPFYNPNYPPEIASGGVADERRIFSSGSSLLNVIKSKKAPVPPWGINPKHIADDVIVFDTIGMVGYFQGPDTKIVDQLGLSDPLLSRLPPHKYNYLPGHYYRDIPEGYLESVISGTNQIKDHNLATFYDKLIVITQGPIFSVARIKTIIEMNCGVYADLIVR
jgi:arabinofuranosyltransferase